MSYGTIVCLEVRQYAQLCICSLFNLGLVSLSSVILILPSVVTACTANLFQELTNLNILSAQTRWNFNCSV